MNRLKNQLHTATRWPVRSGHRAQLARTTLEFVGAMERIYRDEPEQQAVFESLQPLFRSSIENLSLSAEIGGES